ncbi:ATP synthase subunit E [Poronia punctata]|nr:ATP synthase subunit E [Poronia punctata]
MSSSGVNVLRYSALAFGVFYGFTHQRSINASQRAAAAKKEYEHKQQLIEQAKAEFARSKASKAQSNEKNPLHQDPSDPKFDLESFLIALDKEKA